MTGRQPIAWGNARARALIVGQAGEERSAVAKLLAAENIVPATVDSAERAIETLFDSPFDLVVSDIALKGQAEGIGLARWILQHRPETAIILLADTFPWLPANSPVAAVPLVMRPVDTQILLQKIRDVVPTAQTRDVA
jgi:DNA-binding NtrC family response regulator